MNTVVIIGGGVAGLTAGIFAQANGFESTIIEKHRVLGGECTGWDRKGYHIDGCIHWLVGTKESTRVNDLWKSVGALDGVGIYHPETFLTFEHDGTTVHLYRDLDRLRAHWLELSPADADVINEFCDTVRQLHSFDIPCGKPTDMMSIIEKVRMMASLKDAGMVMRKFGKVGLAEYGRRFTHPALREVITSFAPEGYSVSSVLFALATFTNDYASIPVGGSRALAERMVERYLALGGKIEASCEVVDVRIEGARVKGVVCDGGTVHTADHFIAACDAHFVYERLLGSRYNDRAFQKRFDDPDAYPLASNVYIGLGYEGDIGDMQRTLRFHVEPFDVGGKPVDLITMNHYAYEPEFAPEGCTVLTVAINQFAEEIDTWFELAANPDAYRAEKARVGDAVRAAIETRFPEMAGRLTVLDVATPATYDRYCNAHRGAFMAFIPTIGSKSLTHTGRIKGLDNFVLSGQWLQPPGGLPVALLTGKETIQRLCKKVKREFVSEIRSPAEDQVGRTAAV